MNTTELIAQRKQNAIRMTVPIIGDGSQEDPRRPDVPVAGAHYHTDWSTENAGEVTIWLNKDMTNPSIVGQVRSAIAQDNKFKNIQETTRSNK